MLARLISRLDFAIGLQSASDRQRILMAEKLAAIGPRMPWLYAILLINLSGLLVSLPGTESLQMTSGALILLAMAARLAHWARLRGRQRTSTNAVRELRRTFLIGLLICLAYCVWLLRLYEHSGGLARNHIILFSSLGALGCSFALSPLPSSARIPLFLLASPLAVLLISTGDTPYIGMGLTLLTLIYVTTKLVDAQNETFTRLVYSRLDVELEKQRAEAAERSAVAERALVSKIADTDFLTGLANRRALLGAIERTTHGGDRIAVALLDLDGFKAINDTFGHSAGDALLIEASRRLRSLVQSSGMVARLGGDEFALLLRLPSDRAAEALVADAIERLAAPYTDEGRRLAVSACAGLAFGRCGESDTAQIIRMADIALFAAKRKGRGQAQIFSTALESGLKRRAEIELALRAPGVEEEIELAFQPIVDLQTMEVVSFEALARWKHSELGWIPPSEFIPITEQMSVVGQISEALLRRAAAQTATWPKLMRLSFNLSAVQLCSEGSAERLIEVIRTEGLHPTRLKIEVTETALLADFDAARRNLTYLHDHGVRLALDDFGAGYASISYLRELRFDAVKLDGTLITAATNGQAGLPLLRGVLALCREVGLPCIAEHVETEGQVEMLRELGCQFGQGYWLARPMSADRARQVAHARLIPFAPARALKKWTSGQREALNRG